MTEKLFYQDVYIHEFEAEIEKNGIDEQGSPYLVLNQTAFYPTGGGQPFDQGTLNGAQVQEVEEVEGEIRHYTDLKATGSVKGEIDWERRFDHMQQHAGQHILSAVFENKFDAKTISFHLGQEVCSIDLEVESLTEETVLQAEEAANLVILENRPIETKWVTYEELSQYPLRKAVSVKEDIRLVIIPDIDYNGCGGTHPGSTGEVAALNILHTEKQKGNIRVYFVCGHRVRKQLDEKHLVVQSLTARLSAPQDQLPQAADRLLEQVRDLEKEKEELKKQLAELRADGYLSTSNHVIKEIFHDQEIADIQHLAKNITLKADDRIVLFVNETDDKLQVICARGNSVDMNMNLPLKKVLSLINGRGGGKPDFVQGGGEKLMTAEELLRHLEAEL
ncbi:DHHA1 domain-containing protein [Jeotgalibacillus sp. R-1-5s-1]|uniref:alanyl-tRNA editing protein n=1 Tax=Jeotgalibacillus sp. R-1-5s-1 TaxID=2555897 RepID=UPI00106A5AC6|nr:DHHA1 domain-containing protein [Jeotgalibacillus sp. R-1-5s-1]TFE00818.1 alanyl-tRNA editing protein [Jeotgalibacillus sp. R-1-5s-1]